MTWNVDRSFLGIVNFAWKAALAVLLVAYVFDIVPFSYALKAAAAGFAFSVLTDWVLSLRQWFLQKGNGPGIHSAAGSEGNVPGE